ncbi:MAG TPA: PilN domain-containing protein [Gemmatimonadota bacterium]|nr:PilN domain-containing protein [Gemmatimonadota bacterium]
MIEINLHPAAGQKKKRSRPSLRLPTPGRLGKVREDPWRAALLAAVILVPLVILGLWLVQRNRAGGLQDRLETATADSARLAELRVLSDSLRDRRSAIQDRIHLVEQLDRGRFVWPHLMDEISRATPSLAWLTALKEQSGPPNLRVQVLGTAANPLIVTRFVHNLEDSPYLTDVQIVSTQAQQVEGLTAQNFVLTLAYRAPPPDSVQTEPLSTGGT